ncbi:DUF3365 domain-containing protein [Bremerella cremea]|uniref:Tll0287-like domain-containing protein n=1 Tax=Bremerella cremea TaxID=1031537 RepID=UPI0031EB94A7
MNKVLGIVCGLIVIGSTTVALTGCGNSTPAPVPAAGGITPKQFANAVHAVMMADRTVYATHIVTRLKEQGSEVKPSEYWQDEEGTIPLPAQMFRMGSEIVDSNEEAGFTYALKSLWPLNPQNTPKSDQEIEGLKFVAENPGENFYGEEKLGDKTYFTAVYADKAVAKACWDCHNNHSDRGADYPEFKEGDVMGGVVVRIPLD